MRYFALKPRLLIFFFVEGCLVNVFFDRANNWLLGEKRFYGATLFYLLGAKSCLVNGVSVQIKPLRPFVRFKMVIFAFQNITNCNLETILSFDCGFFWE